MPESIFINGDYVQLEVQASEAFSPGQLLEFGGSNDVQKHSSAPDLNGNGSTAKLFARELVETGRGIDDDYSADDVAKVIRPQSGSKIQASIATGVNVTEGTPLESDGNGDLQEHSGLATTGDGTGSASETVADDLVAAYAAEAIDTTSETEATLNEVRVA